MVEHDFLNNKNPTNPKVGVSEEKVSIPYILCAAIWFKDGNKYEHQPKNVDSGIVVCERRHHNCFLNAYVLNGILNNIHIRFRTNNYLGGTYE